MNLTFLNKYNVFPKSRQHAVLHDCKIVFNKIDPENSRAGFANIGVELGKRVEGVLYDIDEEESKLLDFVHQSPYHYKRQKVKVEIWKSKEIVEAYLYLSNDSLADELLPSKNYLDKLLACKSYVSHDYFEWLRSHPTSNDVFKM